MIARGLLEGLPPVRTSLAGLGNCDLYTSAGGLQKLQFRRYKTCMMYTVLWQLIIWFHCMYRTALYVRALCVIICVLPAHHTALYVRTLFVIHCVISAHHHHISVCAGFVFLSSYFENRLFYTTFSHLFSCCRKCYSRRTAVLQLSGAVFIIRRGQACCIDATSTVLPLLSRIT